ncbi:MAG: hypothetical protein ACYTGS_15760 [Planctomycetota bacterium]|jgi:hypothetical protein
MTGVAAWPYEWTVERTSHGTKWPTDRFARKMLAVQTFPVSPNWRWVLVPSPIGPFSVVELQIIVHQENNIPTGYTSVLHVVTQLNTDYEGVPVFTALNWPQDEGLAWQNKVQNLEIQSESDPQPNSADFILRTPAFCGSEWDIG